MKTPVIRINETRSMVFPVYDFNGQPSAPILRPGLAPLVLGTEGNWLIFGASATACPPAAGGGLATGTNINIQIRDVDKNRDFFTYAQDWALNGAPVEHVCGKYGNPHWFNYPFFFKGGTRLMLYASQFSGNQVTDRSPLYVVLHGVLVNNEIAGQTLGSWQKQVSDASGEAYAMTTKFLFSPTGQNLAVGQSRTLTAPMSRNVEFFVDSICARSTDMTDQYINTVDPRVHEPEILMSIRDSITQSGWNQPDPMPISLFAGISGAREFSPPTHYRVTPNADAVVTLINRTAAALDDDFELTLQGCFLKKQGE